MVGEQKNNHGKYLLTITFVSVFSLLTIVIDNNAYAEGQPPSACPNLYDSVITSIIINSGGITYDPVLTPGIVIPAQIGTGYDMSFSLHTSAISNSDNTQLGSTWYDQNIYGFFWGSCVDPVGPNQDITSSTITVPGDNWAAGYITQVYWETIVAGHLDYPGQTTYFIKWQNSPVTSPPPDAPDLSALAVSSSQINLSWDTPPLNTGSVVTGYKIERSIDKGSTWSTIVSNTNSTATTYSDAGLSHSTTYFYRVSAMTYALSGHPSNEAGATTFNVVPSPPVGLTANAFNSSQINLSWTVPSDNGGTPITGYMVERSSDNGTTWAIVSNTNSTATTYSDAGLSPNTTYTYRVSAINSVGTGSPSNTASVTTP